MAAFSIPFPSLSVEKADVFLLELEQQDQVAEAGVCVEGEAAAYALVWEWGNARQTQIGPNTTRGINPDGDEVFLSLQAPRGYIRVNSPLYWAAIQQEMAKVKFTSTETGAIFDQLTKAAKGSATRIAEIIREHVPIDTGQLHDQIKVVSPGDPLLDSGEEDSPLTLMDADNEGTN
jgi:hypothetical protein